MSRTTDEHSTEPRKHYTILKPTRDEFNRAYSVIMRYIDDEPHSRRLFHALLNFWLKVVSDQEE